MFTLLCKSSYQFDININHINVTSQVWLSSDIYSIVDYKMPNMIGCPEYEFICDGFSL